MISISIREGVTAEDAVGEESVWVIRYHVVDVGACSFANWNPRRVLSFWDDDMIESMGLKDAGVLPLHFTSYGAAARADALCDRDEDREMKVVRG